MWHLGEDSVNGPCDVKEVCHWLSALFVMSSGQIPEALQGALALGRLADFIGLLEEGHMRCIRMQRGIFGTVFMTFQEMLMAAVYSRAAYAYTGRRGLFDSVTQGLSCRASRLALRFGRPKHVPQEPWFSQCIVQLLTSRSMSMMHPTSLAFSWTSSPTGGRVSFGSFSRLWLRLAKCRSQEAAFLDMMCLAPEDLVCAQWRSLGPLQQPGRTCS